MFINVEHKTTNKQNSYETTQATRNDKHTKQRTLTPKGKLKTSKPNKHEKNETHQTSNNKQSHTNTTTPTRKTGEDKH